MFKCFHFCFYFCIDYSFCVLSVICYFCADMYVDPCKLGLLLVLFMSLVVLLVFIYI